MQLESKMARLTALQIDAINALEEYRNKGVNASDDLRRQWWKETTEKFDNLAVHIDGSL